jgi:UDP-N-acetylmuramoyl-L-alanyl-D-glutamate--2,6-diaminopimelate ligase
MLLSELLKDINNIEVRNPQAIQISDIILDSRKAVPNSIFVAVKGAAQNGELFIPSAVEKGTVAVLVAKGYAGDFQPNATYIIADDSPQALAEICAKFYAPKPENIIAVTGTNGKTSVANFCSKILAKMGIKSAAIGTLGVCYDGEYPATPQESLTTPDVISLHKTLQNLRAEGLNNVAFEASSHGLEQGRVLGVEVKVAAFTNLTQDHLDYHKTLENYFAAKLKLFSNILSDNGVAVINSDTEYFAEIMQVCKRRSIKVISYGKKSTDVKLVKFTSEPTGQSLQISVFGEVFDLHTKLIGSFQSYNLLCSISMLLALGYKAEKIIKACDGINSVRGRMESVGEKNGAAIIVDYAHTPDALEKAITAIRPHVKGRLITMFGCGGDRDKTKRPLMGAVAAKNSDIVIVTDDNPRTENADAIRAEIMGAAPSAIEIKGRRDAIERGIEMLESGDVLLLAGKGHEDYQIIGTTKNHFNEVEIVQEILSKNL